MSRVAMGPYIDSFTLVFLQVWDLSFNPQTRKSEAPDMKVHVHVRDGACLSYTLSRTHVCM